MCDEHIVDTISVIGCLEKGLYVEMPMVVGSLLSCQRDMLRNSYLTAILTFLFVVAARAAAATAFGLGELGLGWRHRKPVGCRPRISGCPTSSGWPSCGGNVEPSFVGSSTHRLGGCGSHGWIYVVPDPFKLEVNF